MPSDLGSPSIAERIRGHYERPVYGTAPETIHAKLYTYHLLGDQEGLLLAALKRNMTP